MDRLVLDIETTSDSNNSSSDVIHGLNSTLPTALTMGMTALTSHVSQDDVTTMSPATTNDYVEYTSQTLAETVVPTTEAGLVDFEALNIAMTVSLVPTIVYAVLLMAVGVVGNIIVFIVYYRKFKPNATRTFVLTMCVCDLLASIVSLPSEILDIRFFFTFDLPWLCKSVRSFNSFLTTTSAFILVAVARDRFKKICHPLERHRSMTRIYFYVVLCCLGSVALAVTFGFLNGSHTIPTGLGNITGITCSVDDVYVNTVFPLIYNLIMAVTFITCVVVMVVSYVRIAIELWRHQKNFARAARSGGGPDSSSGTDGRRTESSFDEDTSSVKRQDTGGGNSVSKTSIKTKTEQSSVTKKDKGTISNPSDSTTLLSFRGHGEPASFPNFSGSSVTETTFTSSDKVKEDQIQAGHAPFKDPCNEKHPSPSFDQHPNTTSENDPNIVGGATKAKLHEERFQESAFTTSEDCITADDTDPTKKENQTVQTIEDLQQDSMDKDIHSDHILTVSADRHIFQQPMTDKDKSSSLLHKLLTSRASEKCNTELGNSDRRGLSTKSGKSKSTKKKGSGKSVASSTTCMMFVLTAAFIINYLPHLIIISARAVSDGFGQGLTGAVLNVYNIGLRSYYVNCAINSLVYGVCNVRFREECRQLFCGKR